MQQQDIIPNMAATRGNQSTCELVASKLSQSKCTSSCLLHPHRECALFVAWNGVIVLVYEGFPSSLLEVKKFIEGSSADLKVENFGSKWPKTTLGALQDDANDFKMEDLKELRDICFKFSAAIASLKVMIPVQTLSLVEYKCRSLEKISNRNSVALEHVTGAADDHHSTVSPEQLAIADGVVGEWRDLSSYLPKVNAPGSRIGSYRSESLNGATCVAFLDTAIPDALKQQLNEFKATVNRKFPGRYQWMEDKSLHCTLRSLD